MAVFARVHFSPAASRVCACVSVCKCACVCTHHLRRGLRVNERLLGGMMAPFLSLFAVRVTGTIIAGVMVCSISVASRALVRGCAGKCGKEHEFFS